MILKRSADNGYVKALNEMGLFCLGAGNYVEAIRYFTKAVEKNISESQFNLALMYESGVGVRQNSEIAFKWVKVAAEGGHAMAQHHLAQVCL